MSTISLSKKIRKARLEADLSQKELGKALKLSEKSISAYESGRSNPPVSILEKIAKETKKPFWYFSEEDNIESTVMEKLLQIEKQLSELKQILTKREL